MNKPLNIPFGLKPINEELLNTFQQLDNNQLQWLSGYCAGLAHGSTPIENKVEVNNVASQLKTLVLFGSQTGNSESLAKQLHRQLAGGSLNLNLKLDSVDNIKIKDLVKYDLLFLVVSTHGEGEPPDEAIEFYEQINHKRAPNLKGLQHAILALGDSSYEHFCQTGQDFDVRLTALGSTAIIKRLDCDLDYEASSQLWIEQLVKLVFEQSNRQESTSMNALETSGKNNECFEFDNNNFSKSNPLTAKVIANQQITGQGSTKNVHHIELSLEGETFHYLPGDGVAIWPKNETTLVDQILTLLDLSAEKSIQFQSKTQSLKKTLSENLELTLINKQTISAIITLLKESGSPFIETFIREVNAPDFIKQNQLIDLLLLTGKTLSLNAQQLVDLLPALKARVYSISSSLNANPDELHITVGLSQSENERGVRKGVTSQFLIESLQEDDEVLIYIESNSRFRLPTADKPIIMIGPGTGIAPFRAFVQEREENNASGKNWLFFGNPHFNSDFLYQTEWQKSLKGKALFQLDVAFSRDQPEKIYVQDKLMQNAKQIWQWIDQEAAHIYVCGDMSHMAKDVQQTLLAIIAQQGEKSSEEADAYLKQLRKDNRYQRDVY